MSRRQDTCISDLAELIIRQVYPVGQDGSVREQSSLSVDIGVTAGGREQLSDPRNLGIGTSINIRRILGTSFAVRSINYCAVVT